MTGIRKVLVIGGGPSGIATALLLKAENGTSPVVYEANDESKTLGGAIGIPPNGLRLLKRLGLEKEILSRGSSDATIIVHSTSGSVMGRLDLISWSKSQTGSGMVKIKRDDLMEVLGTAAKTADVQIRYGKKLVGIEERGDQVIASFSDGTSDTGDFLIGCDGINSSVRQTYVDPSKQLDYTGIADYYCIVSTTDRPTDKGLLQGLHATITTKGLFALTSCTASKEDNYWFFSSGFPAPEAGEGADHWEQHKKRYVANFRPIINQGLEDVEGEWGDVLRDFVANSNNVIFHPVFSLSPGGKWYRGRCLLIGDAAHAMSPHASQGVSMAMEDAFMLSRLLKEPGFDLQTVFELYDQTRRPRVDEMYQAAKSNGQNRKEISRWRLRLNGFMLTWLLGAYNFFNLQAWGIGQTQMVYDIERAAI